MPLDYSFIFSMHIVYVNIYLIFHNAVTLVQSLQSVIRGHVEPHNADPHDEDTQVLSNVPFWL